MLQESTIQNNQSTSNSYAYGLSRISQTSTTQTAYFLPDALGSVRQMSNGNGDMLFAQDFTPYGKPKSGSNMGLTTYGFTGEQTDPSGLVYLRARYYSPEIARHRPRRGFISTDPVAGDPNKPLTFNPWQYGMDNPILNTDPSGQRVCDGVKDCGGNKSKPYQAPAPTNNPTSPSNSFHYSSSNDSIDDRVVTPTTTNNPTSTANNFHYGSSNDSKSDSDGTPLTPTPSTRLGGLKPNSKDYQNEFNTIEQNLSGGNKVARLLVHSILGPFEIIIIDSKDYYDLNDKCGSYGGDYCGDSLTKGFKSIADVSIFIAPGDGIQGDGIEVPLRGDAAELGRINEDNAAEIIPYYPPNNGFAGDTQEMILQPGTRISRFGSPSGFFASPEGTPNWARSLPPGVEDQPLNTYEVVKPIENVTSGTIAPWFGKVGSGKQYYFGTQNIQSLLDNGYLISK